MKLGRNPLLILLLTWYACRVNAQLPSVRIWPVGDSITEGCCLSVGGAYRTELYQLLSNAGYNVEFVGSLEDVVPPPNLPDTHHEGHDGYRIDDIDAGILTWSSQIDPPDVVLLHIGTNDAAQNDDMAGAPDRLRKLIADIATLYPYAKIIVATLIPAGVDYTKNGISVEEIIENYNASIPGVVRSEAGSGIQVFFTDMHGALSAADLSDPLSGLHPSSNGYAKMATNWFEAISGVIQPLGTPDPPAVVDVQASIDLSHVTVGFSKPISDESVSAGSYQINGGVSVLEAALDSSKRIVTLKTSPQHPKTQYLLTVNHISDRLPQQNQLISTNVAFQSGFVDEAVDYDLVYSLRIPTHADFSAGGVPYDVDNHAVTGPFARVAYYLQLQANGGSAQSLWVSMDAFTSEPAMIGVPTLGSGAFFQRRLANLRVYSNVPGIATGSFPTGGNMEFWWGNYLPNNSESIPGASNSLYDWGDSASPTDPAGYGSMQIHNYSARQTLFAYNGWGGDGYISDLGIGNSPGSNPDWTFAENATNYTTRILQVYVLPEFQLTVNSSPNTTSPSITVVPNDIQGRGDGSGGFTRTYANGTLVSLTAPLTADGRSFQKWQLNGADYSTSPNVSVALSGSETLTAVYASSVVGSFVFYNHSFWDGNDPSANAQDDHAIATDKSPLLPGQVAAFRNYTSYSRGINGIMIDISGLAGNLGLGDVEFRIGNDSRPATWVSAPSPATLAVRRGAGINGSDRVTCLWPDNAIENEWLEVKVLATANTGLAAPYVFFFGNSIGETGDSPSDANVTSVDALRVLRNRATGVSITDPFDMDRDGNVMVNDASICLKHLSAGISALQLINLSAGLTAIETGGSASGTLSPAVQPFKPIIGASSASAIAAPQLLGAFVSVNGIKIRFADGNNGYRRSRVLWKRELGDLQWQELPAGWNVLETNGIREVQIPAKGAWPHGFFGVFPEQSNGTLDR